MLDIIGKRKIYYAISAIFIVASIIALLLWGLKFGIDFKGGSILEVVYPDNKRPETNQIIDLLKPLKLNDLRISPVGDKGVNFRFREADEATHQEIIKILGGNIEERRFSSIGPTIGTELKQKSVKAVIIVLFGISLYIAWAFRKVFRPLSSWRYGVVTLAALFHD